MNNFSISQNIMFEQLTVENGLSNNVVNCLLQDKQGFIWIGTESGLNRYDGYDFKVFRNNPNNKNSISDNSIWSILEDSKGNLWIGTKSGDLNKYSPVTESFTQIKLSANDIPGNSITSIIEDKSGTIWAGTYSHGLYNYNPGTGKINNWRYEPNKKNGLSNNFITSLLEDINGNIWVTTYNGLNYFDPAASQISFTSFFTEIGSHNSVSSNLIWNISQSKYDHNILWICTADGLCYYNLKTDSFSKITIKSKFQIQFSQSFSSVVEENFDEKKILWASSYGGLYKINLDSGESNQFISEKNNSNGLLSNQIDKTLIDRSGVLWITSNKGLNYYSSKARKLSGILINFIPENEVNDLMDSDIQAVIEYEKNIFFAASTDGLFKIELKNKNVNVDRLKQFNGVNIWSLEKGINNSLWIGTYGSGLFKFDLKTSSITSVAIKSPTFSTSAYNFIKSLHSSRNGNLWIGFWGGGLASLDQLTGHNKIWINDVNNSKSISFNDVWALHEDKFGRLWIGTNGGGLNLFKPSGGGEFITWKHTDHSITSIINNSVHYIKEVESENKNETILWLGTVNGLCKITVKNSDGDIYNVRLQIENYLDESNLPDNSVKGILTDSGGEFWISTNKGLVKFNPLNQETTYFSTSDGLYSNFFNSGACTQSQSGLMLYGGLKGVTIFNPEDIEQSSYEPNIVLTELELFNQPVKAGDNSPIKKSIDKADEINLTYQQNVFSIKFSSLDFNSTEQISYAYMMEGFDRDWIISGSRRSVTYTNLSPGSYQFKFKATNSDGVWNKNYSSIKISITPPIWATWWAYSIYFVLLAAGFYAIRKFEINRTRLRNELKLHEFEAQKQRELERTKTRFFANLSHEFRTPLTLISGPLEQLIEGNAGINQNEFLKLIKRNSLKLKELIDQLLEISQIENAAIPLKAKPENISALLRDLVSAFEGLAVQKKLELTFQAFVDQVTGWVDKDKFEKIFNNLLSNAFKFTSPGGNISLTLNIQNKSGNEYAVITIVDSGIGIPEEKLEKIFDRFYQIDDKSNRSFGGSGIGLALVKELVELHRWKIEVKSKLGIGTEFILYIPLYDSYLDENQKLIAQVLSAAQQQDGAAELHSEQEEKSGTVGNTAILKNKNENKRSILVVEDSQDMRTYLKGLLENEYDVIEASNGNEGVLKASQLLPDIIISDIMMPGMDGVEFCKRVKGNWETCHIPVILLTAKASGENKIEGLETGADDYLTKPFSFRELSIRIKNLLDQRNVLREKFGKDLYFKPENITPDKADQDFLQKVITAVEKNISDAGFDSEKLSKEIFLSRSQLHRKLLSITGQATGEFIRTTRLKKAAGLIVEKEFSVTQIAFEVGFSSPSHFTKAFKQMFNCLPSEFINRSNS